MPPCIIFEDEHLLVVHKPAGWNTHAPAPYVGEGIYEWLRHREPRWAGLAVLHRLDKETSGVLVLGKTSLANRSLTQQFAARTVRKEYVLLTDREPDRRKLVVRSKLRRAGQRYASAAHGEEAETRFRFIQPMVEGGYLAMAEPVTGRTHQIRVHAAEQGFPILGDVLYGGAPAGRMFLRADKISLQHPVSHERLTFQAWSDFSDDSRRALRAAVIEPEHTTAYRLVHGAGDGWPGLFLDRFGEFLLAQTQGPLTPAQRSRVESEPGAAGLYHRMVERQARCAPPSEASPQRIGGAAAPDRFPIRENGVTFELTFNQGGSAGLFLDQRDNRRRLLTGHVAAAFPVFTATSKAGHPGLRLLNTFAYTCGFSVCAALAGMHTTSLDLSKKHLEWGKRNFTLNGLDPAGHEFIYGDAFDWLRRLAKKGRMFDVVVLDPPTFSHSKASGIFRAEKDYGKLAAAALPLLRRGGVLFASANAAELPPGRFLDAIHDTVRRAGRALVQEHYVPQPPDFPVSRAEPAHLKTAWLRIG